MASARTEEEEPEGAEPAGAEPAAEAGEEEDDEEEQEEEPEEEAAEDEQVEAGQSEERTRRQKLTTEAHGRRPKHTATEQTVDRRQTKEQTASGVSSTLLSSPVLFSSNQ